MRSRATVWAVIAGLLLLALPGQAQEAKERLAVQRQVRTAPTNILVMFSDGKQPQDLPAHDKAPLPRVTPALAPDGATLAFAAKVGDTFKLFTWTLNAQNQPEGEPRQVTTGDTSDRFPSWSPDGNQLAYLAQDAAGKTTLRVINSDGSGMKVLPETKFNATPSWRADGQWLLYVDLEGKAPTLKNVMLTGNAPLPIHPAKEIIAASQAPATAKDTISIAVLVRNPNGLCDLCIIKPFGLETKKVVSQIDGAKSVQWVNPETIVFNATKVGTQTGSGVWLVNPEGGKARGLNVFTDPKAVAYAAMQKANLEPQLPTIDPNAGVGPNPAQPNDPLPTGPVTIMRPHKDTAVRGVVPVKIYTQPKVASVVLRINDQFMFAATPQTDNSEPAPYLLFNWDTLAFIKFDPASGNLPTRYNQLLRFPDGAYTISVQAVDAENKQVPDGRYSVKVTVQNGLPDTDFPQNTVLKYKGGDEVIDLRAEGTLFGATAGQAPELDAALELTIRRTLIEAKATGFDVRVEVREPQSGYSLSYGLKEASIPEAGASALYHFNQDGSVSVVEQLREKIYLPLSACSTPVPTFAVTRESQWPKAMNIVLDLLNRDNTNVQASHSIDGMEWVNGKRAIRIRSEFKLDPRWTPFPFISTKPTARPPDERTTRADLLKRAAMPAGPGVAPTMAAPTAGAVVDTGNSIKFTECAGVRYTWYDYQANALLRVEDFVLYTFPVTNLPSAAAATVGDPGNPGGAPAWGTPPPAEAPPPLGGGANPFGAPATAKPAGGKSTAKVGSAFYLIRFSYAAKSGE